MAESKSIPKWIWQVAAVILLAAVLFLWYQSCNRDYAVGSEPGIDSLAYWKNKAGQKVASLKAAENQFSITSKRYLDSIASLYRTKEKLVNQITVLTQKGSVVIKTPGAPVIVYKDRTDTVAGGCFVIDYVEQDFVSPYYKAHARVVLNGVDTSTLQLETYDTLTYVDKVVKSGSIFNRKRFLQVDVSNANPDNKITGLSVYRKALPNPKKVGIGLQVGGRVTVSKTFVPQVKPYAGIGASWNFIRL